LSQRKLSRRPHRGPLRGAQHGAVQPLTAAAMLIALLLTLPVLGVLGHLGSTRSWAVWRHLAETVLAEATLTSVLLGALVTGGTMLVGTGAAWLVTQYEFAGRRWFAWLLMLPLAMPAYVAAYAYTDFLQFSGPVQSALRAALDLPPRGYWFPEIRSLPGAALLFTAVLYPYVYALARPAFIERGPNLVDAARALGCAPRAVFWRVALPLARPAMMAGGMLALMETLSDYGAVAYFGLPTFTQSLYNAWFNLGDRAAAAQLAAALLLVVAVVVTVERRARGARRFATTAARGPAAPQPLHGLAALRAIVLCSLPVLAGFVLPAALLLRLHLGLDEAPRWSAFAGWLGNSVVAGGVTAALAVALAVLVAYAGRLDPGPLMRAAGGLVGLGYALPGSVIAVGVLVPMARFDNALDAWLRAQFGFGSGLLLTGSLVALVYAYLVRYLAVAYHGIDAGLARITPSMDLSARSLGASPGETLLRVHAPLLSRSVLAAAVLVFVDTVKELPATLVLRPFNFDTLAVVTHHFAKDERLAEAALPALAIVAVGLLPALLLSRGTLLGEARGQAAGRLPRPLEAS
jgi:iron(III) transport system permease protein